MAAIKSRLECMASESTPRLPVATARNTLSATRTSAEPMDPSAAICLTDVEDRMMGKSSEGIIRCGKMWRMLQLARGCHENNSSVMQAQSNDLHQAPQAKACATRFS